MLQVCWLDMPKFLPTLDLSCHFGIFFPDLHLFVPFIQWNDRIHITGNGRFLLKPYIFTQILTQDTSLGIPWFPS